MRWLTTQARSANCSTHDVLLINYYAIRLARLRKDTCWQVGGERNSHGSRQTDPIPRDSRIQVVEASAMPSD